MLATEVYTNSGEVSKYLEDSGDGIRFEGPHSSPNRVALTKEQTLENRTFSDSFELKERRSSRGWKH